MKKFFNLVSVALMALAMTASFTSCSKDNSGDDPTPSVDHTAEYSAMAANLVDVTIKTTYKNLADNAQSLADMMETMRDDAKEGKVTQSQVDACCTMFKSARMNYELSEAFLLGAASQFNCDPHIDSWPLDVDQLEDALTSAKFDKIEADEDGTYVSGALGQNVLGFHAIEYILFRDGQNRTADFYNTGSETMKDKTVTGIQELVYAAAVAKDLRNNCFQMECGWNPETNAQHCAWLDEIEMDYTNVAGISFGEDFKGGKSYGSIKAALAAILVGNKGAKGICDEVADTKMGKPSTGEDINYIESPYSWNSLTDFYDNIGSIMDVWYGTYNTESAATSSFSAYFKKYHATEGAAVETAIKNARTAIQACPAPFVKYYKDAKVTEAIEACHDLSDALTDAYNAMQND